MSPFFPYTTLFRSLDGEAYFTVPSRGHSDFDEEEELFQVFTRDGVIRVLGTRFAVSSHDNRTVVVLEEGRDRKSTRLNSSHVAISYAVFCLKKKKTQ